MIMTISYDRHTFSIVGTHAAFVETAALKLHLNAKNSLLLSQNTVIIYIFT